MDSQIIYVKTAAGEAAVQQRTRVMQRNVRMVLILVDGKSTVADLILKTGNQKLTENALRELEKSGFVELVVEQDSLWAEGKKVAQEIRDAALNKARKLVTPENGGEQPVELPAPSAVSAPPVVSSPSPASAPSVAVTPPASSARERAEPSLSDTSISLHSVFATSKGASSLSGFSVAPIPPMQFGKPVDGQLSSVFSQPEPKSPVQESADSGGDAKPGLLERIKGLLPSGKRSADDSFSIKPVERGQKKSMSLPAMAASILFGMVALAVLVVLAFPYGSYLPEVESTFTKATGQRVKVGSLRVDLYPKVGLLLGDVRVGQEGQEFKVSSIRLQPVVSSLFSKKASFRKAVLSGVTLSPEAVMAMPGVFAALANPMTGVAVDSIALEQVEASFNGLGFTELLGEFKTGEDGRFQSLLLNTVDRGLTLEFTPQGKALGVSLEGYGWRPSAKSPYLFTSVSVKGRIEKTAMSIDEMDLRLFDGAIKGTAALGGSGQPYFSGKASFERINAKKLGEALGIGPQFSGEIAGTATYAAVADSWDGIFAAMLADGEFTVRRGSVQGIDLAEAVRQVSGKPVEGGRTAFEQLSGKIKLTPTAYQFSSLVTDSGLMQAVGTVDVGKDLRINGKMELQMRGSVNQMRVPVTISGPLKAPTVQVGK